MQENKYKVELSLQKQNYQIKHRKRNIPAPMPDEYSIHSPVKTLRVVPKRFKELLILHNLRKARRAALSNLVSPVRRDSAPISRIREPTKISYRFQKIKRDLNEIHVIMCFNLLTAS